MSPGMPVPSPQAAAAPGWSGQIALEARTARPPSAHTHLMQPRRSLRQRPSPPPLRRPRRRPRRARSRCRRWPTAPAGGGVGRPPWRPGQHSEPGLPRPSNTPLAHAATTRPPQLPPPLPPPLDGRADRPPQRRAAHRGRRRAPCPSRVHYNHHHLNHLPHHHHGGHTHAAVAATTGRGHHRKRRRARPSAWGKSDDDQEQERRGSRRRTTQVPVWRRTATNGPSACE